LGERPISLRHSRCVLAAEFLQRVEAGSSSFALEQQLPLIPSSTDGNLEASFRSVPAEFCAPSVGADLGRINGEIESEWRRVWFGIAGVSQLTASGTLGSSLATPWQP
jgi:hypothetical protein